MMFSCSRQGSRNWTDRAREVARFGVCLGLVVVGSACVSPQPIIHVIDGATMGTTYTVRVVTIEEWDQRALDGLGQRIQQTLDGVEAKMSHYDPASELSRFNRHATTDPYPVSPETLEVVGQAQALSAETGGALDITVGPFVNAWGFGPVEPLQLPPDEAWLARLRDDVGYTKLELDVGAATLRKTTIGLECDLSSVAKGYGVDLVADRLRAQGLSRFMVEVGGEIVTAGMNERGEAWRIGIAQPVLAGGIHMVVSLVDRAMATSGDYQNTREIDGRVVSHTIDPRTGRPVAHTLASVSVIAPRAVVADGLATALEVLGPDDGYTLAVDRGWAALFLERDGAGGVVERVTPAFQGIVESTH